MWKFLARRGKTLSVNNADGHRIPFTSPGNGLTPDTRDYQGGPEPASYGIPPDSARLTRPKSGPRRRRG